MQVNSLGLSLIKTFEGCRLNAYKDPVGIWTIGYGSTGPEIKEGLKWTALQAEDRLRLDLSKFEKGVKSLAKVDLNENEFSALVCFSYNLGLNNLRVSHLMLKINSDLYQNSDIMKEFAKWNKAGGKVLPGLVARRNAEGLLFCGEVKEVQKILDERTRVH